MTGYSLVAASYGYAVLLVALVRWTAHAVWCHLAQRKQENKENRYSNCYLWSIYSQTFDKTGAVIVIFNLCSIYNQTFDKTGAVIVIFNLCSIYSQTFGKTGTVIVIFNLCSIYSQTFDKTGTVIVIFYLCSIYSQAFDKTVLIFYHQLNHLISLSSFCIRCFFALSIFSMK